MYTYSNSSTERYELEAQLQFAHAGSLAHTGSIPTFVYSPKWHKTEQK